MTAHDSRSHGSAACAGCSEDLCDHAAGAGLILCPSCFEIQVQIAFSNPELMDAGVDPCSPKQAALIKKNLEIQGNPLAPLEATPDTCCDLHALRDNSDLSTHPCAAIYGQGFAPEFTPAGGLFWDFENAFFGSWVEHLIKDLHILEILEGWESTIHCPACDTSLVFDREGQSVLATCDGCRVGATLAVVL